MSEPKQQPAGSRFFFFYSIALLCIVMTGFAPSFFLRGVFEDSTLPLYLHLHGALLTGWFVVLVVQSGLVRRGSLFLHTVLGRVAAVYGLLVAVASLMATVNMLPRELATGLTLESDMADVNPTQAAGISFLEYASGIVWFNLSSVIAFVLLLALAVKFRRRRAYHKRFLMVASLSLVLPALARISRILFETEQGLLIPVSFAMLLLALLVYDVRSLRRVHPANVLAMSALFVLNVLAGAMAVSSYGIALTAMLA